MSQDLYSLAYFSRNAIEAVDEAAVLREIDTILAYARERNEAQGITGALLYSAGCFAQVLEGPLSEVEDTFERIQLDARHREVTLLQFNPVERRSFADWSMAFAGVDADAPARAAIGALMTQPESNEGMDVVAILRDIIARYERHGL